MNPSSVFKHLLSLIYDIFPILGILITTSLVVMLIKGDEVDPGTFWFQMLLSIEIFLYFTYSWKSGGQTLGMRAWKIAIFDHTQLTWGTASLRFVVGIASIATLGLGLWTKLWNKDNKTWMDLASQTQTVSIKKA